MHQALNPVAEAPLLPLSRVPAGVTVRIERVGDCPAMRSRLLALGLTPGSTARVDSCCCGQCCLCVRGGSLAIGHGMADKILVRVVAAGTPGAPLPHCRCRCRDGTS